MDIQTFSYSDGMETELRLVPGFYSGPLKVRLRRLKSDGIRTTLQFIDNVRLHGIEGFARHFDLEVERVTAALSICDLMRVQGVGTRTAQFMREAGICSVEDLRREDVDSLQQKLSNIEREYESSKVRTRKQLQDIIEFAGRISVML